MPRYGEKYLEIDTFAGEVKTSYPEPGLFELLSGVRVAGIASSVLGIVLHY